MYGINLPDPEPTTVPAGPQGPLPDTLLRDMDKEGDTGESSSSGETSPHRTASVKHAQTDSDASSDDRAQAHDAQRDKSRRKRHPRGREYLLLLCSGQTTNSLSFMDFTPHSQVLYLCTQRHPPTCSCLKCPAAPWTMSGPCHTLGGGTCSLSASSSMERTCNHAVGAPAARST